jgi:methionyl-tRNA formyltransferase
VRIVFLGTPATAVPSLRALASAGHTLSLVVSQPDRPVGRSRRLQPTPVKQAAVDAGWPCFQPTKVRNAAFRETLAAARPDLLVVVAYGRILPSQVLALPSYGAINLHFSLLPKYRGAAPVQWTLARGEAITGVTTMQMDEGLDTGDLLLQQEVSINDQEHTPQLIERLASIGAELLVETVGTLEQGTLKPRHQDPSAVTLAPILTKEDGLIDLAQPARLVEGHVRGFDPWPGGWLRRGDHRLRIVKARALGGPACEAPAGTVIERVAEGVVLACGAGTRLLLLTVQTEGRRAISALDALNGRQLELHEAFDPLPERKR